MANLVGVNHLPYVIEQINLRQEILGRSIRTNSDQVWANGRTSWIKLISGVNIRDQQIYTLQTGSTAESSSLIEVSDNGAQFRNKKLGINGYNENDLAKELILMGGTLNPPNSADNPDDIRFPLKSSISNTADNSPNNSSNYGFGGNEFGFKAAPGILSFNSKTYNNGSLREATVTIVANNRKQFEYIESIYLRLGYTMFLEWGNTTYPISDTEYAQSTDLFSNSLANAFLKGGIESDFYTQVEENRKLSKGNYDGFLGTVKNFSWEFTTEGTYNITLNLISKGSVIESLKIALPTQEISNSPQPEGEDETANLKTSNDLDKEYDNALITIIEALSSPIDPNVEDKVYVNFFTGNIQKSTWFASRGVDKVNYEPVKRDVDNKAFACCAIFGGTKFVKYLRFKDFLDQINANLLLYNENNDPVLFSIDTSEDLYCYSNGYSISSDPSKMIIKQDKVVAGIPVKIFAGKGTVGEGNEAKEVDFNIEDFHKEINGAQVGSIMDLYFSTDYLIQEVKNNIDNENNLSLNTLLSKLLSTASNLLGGVNKFRTRLAEKRINGSIKQVFEIYDEVQPYNKDKIIGQTPRDFGAFRIYGLDDQFGEGSFVTQYNLKTEISKKLETMIAIGAQANGTGVGIDSTIFSKWNRGLVDRIVPKKLSQDELKAAKSKVLESAKSPYVKFARLQTTYLETLNLFSEFSSNATYKTPKVEEEKDPPETYFTGYGFPNVYLTATEGQINFTKFISLQKEYFTKALAVDALIKKSATPTTGFLPINLSLTFDGLSGIKIFDKLEIISEFLPSNYGETLEFIITELDHFFEGNKWFTRVGTLSIPKLSRNPKKQAKVDIDTIFKSTIIFDDDADLGIVGEESYDNSALGAKIITTYFSAKREANQINKKGFLYLPEAGPKNKSQQSGTGKITPLVKIGELGGKYFYKTKYSNVTMSNQSANAYKRDPNVSSRSLYKDQYNGNYYLARPAAIQLTNLISQAKTDGISFTITSAYRSTYHQKRAGTATNSPHEYGGAIDIGELYSALDPKGSIGIEQNAIVRNTNSLYKWLEENGPKYGWYNPYRLRNNSGMNEVWHWEYWGDPTPGDVGTYSFSGFSKDNNDSLQLVRIPELEDSPNLSVK